MLAVFPHENADMNLSHVCKQMTYMGWNTVAPGGGGGRGGAGEGLVPAVKFWLSQAFVQHRMDLTLKGSKDFVAVFLPFHKTTSGYCCIFKKQINGLTKSNNIFLSVMHKVIVVAFSRILKILQDAFYWRSHSSDEHYGCRYSMTLSTF